MECGLIHFFFLVLLYLSFRSRSPIWMHRQCIHLILTCLYLSLKAKFKAWVGKYLITLAMLPRQYEAKPCSFGMRTKQSIIPLYCLSGLICLEMCCTCKSNLTRSMGATAVFETAAEIPPAAKSFMKPTGSKASLPILL